MKKTLLLIVALTAANLLIKAQVGIGTSTPTQMLHLFNSSSTTAIRIEGNSTSYTPTGVAKNPGTVVNQPYSYHWVNLSNVSTSDNQYSSVSIGGWGGPSGPSSTLKASNFGFNIPTGATITGIIVSVERNSPGPAITDYVVQLISSGSAIGDNVIEIQEAEIWGATDEVITYGANNNLWGASLTPAIINGTTFGVQIQVDGRSGVWEDDPPAVASIDHITITAYYTGGSTSESWTFGKDNSNFKISSGASLGTNDHITILPSGNVGMGYSMPTEKLEVNGNVKASSFIATYTTTGAYKYNTSSNMTVPDYVFESYFDKTNLYNPEYKMLTIHELEKFLQTNKHLPRVPSRDEIAASGALNMQGISMVNLEKTEENTLYILELNNKIALLQKEIDKLKAFNSTVLKQLELLKEK